MSFFNVIRLVDFVIISHRHQSQSGLTRTKAALMPVRKCRGPDPNLGTSARCLATAWPEAELPFKARLNNWDHGTIRNKS